MRAGEFDTFAALGLERPGEDVPQFTRFEQFAETLPEAERDMATAQFERSQEGPWSDADCPHVVNWLEMNEPALALLTRYMERPRYYAPLAYAQNAEENPWLLSTRLPHLSLQRALLRAYGVRAFRAIELGALDAVWHEVMTVKHMAALVSHETVTIGQLVAISIDSFNNQIISQWAASPRLTEAEAKRMIGELDQVASLRPAWYTIDVERLNCIDILQHLQRDARLGELMNLLDGVAVQEAEETMQRYDAYIRDPAFDVERAVNRIHAASNSVMKAMQDEDYSRATDSIRALAKERAEAYKRAKQTFNDPDELPRLLTLDEAKRGALLADLTADLIVGFVFGFEEKVRITELKNTATNRLALTALALAGYRAEHGRYPETLEALVPDYLDAVPVDPFTGGAMVYRVEEDGVIVYSVSRDQQDDGGREYEEAGDAHDIVVRLPK